MLRKIVQVGNPKLRGICLPYTKEELHSTETKKLISRLHKKLITLGGVGLAGPQVGVQKQVFVLNIHPTKYRINIKDIQPYAVFNPVIKSNSKEKSCEFEGCFSVANADLFAKVYRPLTIDVNYLNEAGQEVSRTIEGLEARVFMHEYDHLHGKVFLEAELDTGSFMGGLEYRASVGGV